MEICRITVPCDPATLGPNGIKKKRLREQMTLKKRAWQTARLCWIQAGKPIAKQRVIVHFIVRRAREMDEANIIGGLKYEIDGLFVNAITPDDKPKFMKLGLVEQEIDSKY